MSRIAEDRKAAVTAQARRQLNAFLAANERLILPRPTSPRLSILLVLYNRAELTLACLRSLQPHLQAAHAEVVLVDNASGDETGLLLDCLDGAKIVRNRFNEGFACGVNRAAEAADGAYLLLLNNDTEVLDDSICAALDFLADQPTVGAVGGRLILLDGTLQEAGCTLWREGHVFQYGRGDDPSAPEYRFQRDVDYCSGSFLLTRRELFQQMGGLDVAFSPGYFEDVDFCVRLWRAGWRVAYRPDIAVRHFENASSTCSEKLHRLYRRNHLLFTQKHADWLAWKRPSATASPLWMRTSHDDRYHVLYVPDADCADLAGVVGRLRERNCFVTVYPLMPDTTSSIALPPDVERLPGGSRADLARFLHERRGYYDCVLANGENAPQCRIELVHDAIA